MRIVVTGAMGGIGRHLVQLLAMKHDVVGVVRTAPSRSASRSPVQYVSSADGQALARCLQEADVVIHAALDTRKRGDDFIRRNTAFTRELLELSRNGASKLFVYFSSWVVYSGTEPGETGYCEDQRLETGGKLDDYTRLKLAEERLVTKSCHDTGTGYLILRPTIVLGPGLTNPNGAIRMARWLPVGVRARTMNLIHVVDLCQNVERLLDLGVSNQVFNLGGSDVASEDYFKAVGHVADRKMRFLPEPLIRRARLPSTAWFIKSDVRIDCEKVQRVTGIRPQRSLAELVAPDALSDVKAGSLEAMRQVRESGVPFKAYGLGYSLLLNPRRRVEREKRVLLEPYRGIVSLNGDLVTVKSGTMLSDITKFLDQVDLTLATLPEFSGITAGACFFVDVHGSSNEHFSLLDLIVEVKYLQEDGRVATARPGDAIWEELRRRDTGFFVTEVTFQCQPAGYLTNRIEFKDDALLAEYVSHEHRKNLSTVIEWYPYYRKFMLYNINKAESRPPNTAGPMFTFRHAPYRFQRFVYALRMRGRDTLYGRHADILAPWKDLPRRDMWYRLQARDPDVFGTELRLSVGDGTRLVRELQAMQRGDEPLFGTGSSLGLRFSYRTMTDGRRTGYVWIEWVTKDLDGVKRFADQATALATDGVSFHQGKYVPA